MQGFSHNKLEIEKFERLWLENLESVYQNRTPKYASVFYRNLFPEYMDLSVLKEELEKQITIAKEKKMTAFQKILSESVDLLNKRIKAH